MIWLFCLTIEWSRDSPYNEKWHFDTWFYLFGSEIGKTTWLFCDREKYLKNHTSRAKMYSLQCELRGKARQTLCNTLMAIFNGIYFLFLIRTSSAHNSKTLSFDKLLRGIGSKQYRGREAGGANRQVQFRVKYVSWVRATIDSFLLKLTACFYL